MPSPGPLSRTRPLPQAGEGFCFGAPLMATLELDEAKARELEEKFDTEIRFRPLAPLAGQLVGTLLVILSLFHYYTAGFGLLPEMEHRGIHLSFVLGLIFLVFPLSKR